MEICSFHQRIGVCRHADKCKRVHERPVSSHTVLCRNLYQNPAGPGAGATPPIDFDSFFTDVFVEMALVYGEVEAVAVCENTSAHMDGNVYVRFADTAAAARAVAALNERWYNGRPVFAELTQAEDFGAAACRPWDRGECTRGDRCNFMHLKRVLRGLEQALVAGQRAAPANPAHLSY